MTDVSAHTTTDGAVARARAVVRLNTAYFRAKVLQSAVELGVFDLLDGGPQPAADICAKLGIRHRLAVDYLDALTGLGLLERDGDRYGNSATAAEFLVSDRPAYLGGTARQHAKLHYHAWGKLADAMREGRAQSAVAAQGAKAYVNYYEDLEQARRVMTHMDAHNGFTADEIARQLDWRGYTTVTDVGGARGNVAARIVQAVPHLRGHVVDLPALRPLFDELMAQLGTAGQVQFHGGDFFADPIPESDVIVVGHVLADWPQPRRVELLRRCHAALRPGGTVVVYDVMVDDDRDDVEALLQRLNSAMIRDDMGAYRVTECAGYLREVGFTVEKAYRTDTITRDHFVIGRKAAS
ncbi:hypothetical protein Daura_37845 [Dactylosporangium aurantiacum]|uniref:O-methyltransferase n=1 Tax=Dactylosporangium aurantiacum TaxID=35754 RepID=A0A9Q9I9L3_9ACTN|nr:methyltransferase [Dactylosporangium aurantiacum]MDG6101817.1 methyltransferase [Dactylosporangium aurantiacum]UWZ52379.1 hypothetical protein Daura_37845 [Dactylosporangium aurantiacum]